MIILIKILVFLRVMVQSKINKILLLFFMSILWNCAGNQQYKNNFLEGEIPNAWSSPLPETEVFTGTWWSAFEDEKMTETLYLFREKSPDLQSVLQQLKSAKNLAIINGAGFFPSLGLNGSSSKGQQNLSGFGFSDLFSDGPGLGQDTISNQGSNEVISFESDSYGLNLSLQWEVDIWGRALNSRKAAFKDYASAEYDLAYLSFSLLTQFVQAYYVTVEARQQFDLSQNTVIALEEVLALVEVRFKEGLRSSLDYRLAQSSLAISQVQMETRRVQYLNSLRNLEILIGNYPSASLEISVEIPQTLPPIPSGLPSDLLLRRPDIKAAVSKVESAGYRVAEAKRSLLPRIDLTGSAGTSTDELKDILNGDYGVWNMGTNITAPIFQGGRLRANVAMNESQLSQAEIDLVKKSLLALSEVEQAIAAEASVNRQMISLELAVFQAKAAYDLSVERYESGLTDLITVLNSQNQWFNSQSQFLSMQRQRVDSRLRLMLALGGSFNSKTVEIDQS